MHDLGGGYKIGEAASLAVSFGTVLPILPVGLEIGTSKTHPESAEQAGFSGATFECSE